MNKTKLVAALAGVAILGSACSSINTQRDQAGLHYKGGPFSSTKFANCVPAGTRNFDGPADKHYSYPAGQRTFDFSGGEGADANPLRIVSEDNQELAVSGGLTFSLDTSCTTLRKFHEQIGLKYSAFMDGDRTSHGWVEMLRFYVGQPLRKAMNQAAQKYGWLALYNDPTVRVKFEREVANVLPKAVTDATGGNDYFGNFNLTLQKPEPDPKLVSALAAAQVAITNRKAVRDQNATVHTELRQIRSLSKVLGPYGYILYKALQSCAADNASGCPSLLPIPEGTNVTINGGGGK